jgi:hypothetical protein
MSLNINIALMVFLTSLHHVYGAFHYDTMWRLHTLIVNLPLLLLVLIISRPSILSPRLEGIRIFITSFFWIAWVGIYEGIYNHLIKNIIFFTTPSVYDFFFPSSIYERPNDLIFELTGLAQILILPNLMRATYSRFKILKKSLTI